MAEYATITRSNAPGTSLYRIHVAWESHTDGTKQDVSVGAIDGKIVQFVTDPGASAPDASYDITLDDADSIDVSGGALTNLSATLTEVNRPSDGASNIDRWTMGNHTLTFAGLGADTADGEISIYYVVE